MVYEAVFWISEASDPTGSSKVFFAVERGDSPRRYIRYAATTPAVKVRRAKSLLGVGRSIGWFPQFGTYAI
jgi:hypothetical protein